MKVFLPKDKKVKDIVQNVDDNILQGLVQSCFGIKKMTNIQRYIVNFIIPDIH